MVQWAETTLPATALTRPAVMDDDELQDGRRSLEQRIEKIIRRELAKIDIGIANDVNWPVSYDEDDGMAVVVLAEEADGWSVQKLKALYDSGLSDDYTVAANTVNHLELRFKVKPELIR